MAISTGSEPEGLSMGKLSGAERKKLPSRDFALPAKRAYPIPDKSHAANALSRISANGTPAEKAEVRAKVDHAFPTMEHAHKHLDDKAAY